MAKKIAKQEKQQPVERWVTIEFRLRNSKDRSFRLLHTIKLPCYMLERWHWVILWREAKLICQYPFKSEYVETTYCYHRKTMTDNDFQTVLNRLSATKAQVTIVERRIEKYVKERTANDMFFNPATDERLIKEYAKLKQKKQNVEERQQEVNQLTEKYMNESSIV